MLKLLLFITLLNPPKKELKVLSYCDSTVYFNSYYTCMQQTGDSKTAKMYFNEFCTKEAKIVCNKQYKAIVYYNRKGEVDKVIKCEEIKGKDKCLCEVSK